MISLVPPVIALTILLSFTLVADQDREDVSVSVELARDMIRHHQHHFEVATRTGFPVGEITDPLPYPLEPLASWRSEVVQQGAQRLLLTWADGYGTDSFAPSAYRGVVEEIPDRIGLGGVSGVIAFPGVGSAMIGEVEVPLPTGPIAAGAPAILRRGG